MPCSFYVMCNGRGAHGKSLWKRKYARTPAELKDIHNSMFFANSRVLSILDSSLRFRYTPMNFLLTSTKKVWD